MQWGYPPSMLENMLSSRDLTRLMTYEQLYPSGFELESNLNAHLVRSISYGALQDPSGDLDDHKLYHEPSEIVADEVPTTVDAIKDEQLRVLDTLDLLFN